MTFRLFLLKTMEPIVKFIGKLKAPYSHKLTKSADLISVLPIIEPGLVLISHTSGELTNAFIPGYFTHAAIVSRILETNGYRIPMVIEAVGTGVREVDLMSFLFSKDAVAIMRPKFADSTQMALAAVACEQFLGNPYDYYFEPEANSFYCSELIQEAYSLATNSTSPFTKRKTLGVYTVVPQDYFDAKDKFELAWLSDAASHFKNL